ncbi:MAG: deoxyribodipyrimidine photo-lyase [Chlamydiae bacterium]|nr:deoxyribodipyrimidine photo-lyase [Chlamydiota bacterium]
MKKKCIVWFTQDLRLSDHRALLAAIDSGYEVIPLYIYRDEDPTWKMGAASKWWLHYSLKSLSDSLEEKGARLIVRKGPTLKVFKELIKDTGASAVFWHSRVEPFARKEEESVKELLKSLSCESFSFWDNMLFVPGDILNGQGEPYKVFTPFYNKCMKVGEIKSPLKTPRVVPGVKGSIHSENLEKLALLPDKGWDSEFSTMWHPGEKNAKVRLQKFCQRVTEYTKNRDFPYEDGTSLLSPHLHFGEISASQVVHSIRESSSHKGEGYVRQLIWREFAAQMLYFCPKTDLHPLREEFAAFPWKKSAKHLRQWQEGQTGYPIVDAGMRQLWRLGFMHNRLRMIVGSFLVKDLLIPWQEGAFWFWDTLLDADLANNSFGWQWVSGCGADAAPYFRIFNPITQGEKFDPEGSYVRAFVPELKDLPSKWIHKPWEAPVDVLRLAGVVLGKTYPRPIVDHDEARKIALEALKYTRK